MRAARPGIELAARTDHGIAKLTTCSDTGGESIPPLLISARIPTVLKIGQVAARDLRTYRYPSTKLQRPDADRISFVLFVAMALLGGGVFPDCCGYRSVLRRVPLVAVPVFEVASASRLPPFPPPCWWWVRPVCCGVLEGCVAALSVAAGEVWVR